MSLTGCVEGEKIKVSLGKSKVIVLIKKENRPLILQSHTELEQNAQ